MWSSQGVVANEYTFDNVFIFRAVPELLAGILLLSRWYGLGAIVGLGTITGAIFFHLTVLGIEVQGDGGYLFILALTVFMACTLLILLHFKEVKNQLLSAIKK